MSRFWKSVLVFSVVSVFVACGGKGGKTDAKAKDTKAESKTEETKAEAPPPNTAAPAPSTTPATPPPATPALITDTAVPPDTAATPAAGADTLLDPDVNKYESYLIKTKDGTEVEVKYFWKEKGKVTFQKAGGDISLAVENITSIEGRLKGATE